MKIALFGYGKMGQLVEQLAKSQGHHVTAIFSQKKGISPLRDADVAIDFSVGTAVLDNLDYSLKEGKPIVIGTTGWESQLEKAKKMVSEANGSCLHAPNFSIGVFLYQKILRYAAGLLQPFQEYDVSGIEMHHKQKLDAPSGTAKAITKDLLQAMPRVDSFEFSSVRSGHIPGTHTVQFDSSADTLVFTHQARNRQAFAQGALTAASWLIDKKGFFSLEDMMKDFLPQDSK